MREYLRELRIKKELTQLDMAKKLDLSESYYSLIENGKRQRKMEFPLLCKLSNVLAISIEVLVQKESDYQKNVS